MNSMIGYLVTQGLTLGQAKVADLILQGLSNQAAAKALGISEKSIKFHATNIYKKMDVKSRNELMAKFLAPSPVVKQEIAAHTNKYDKGSSQTHN